MKRWIVTGVLAFALVLASGALSSAWAGACPDIDGDGYVDAQDLVLFRTAFLGPFDPACDFNGDGLIDLRDLNIFRICLFGGACPC